MRDYDELVRRLLESADWADHFAVLMGRIDGDVHAPIMREAADAIEELLRENDAPGRSLCNLNAAVVEMEHERREIL